MTQEQINARNAKIKAYYASEPAEKKAERVEKIKAYHAQVHHKKEMENRAKVARKDIERAIATLQYLIGEIDTLPADNE